ncbi:MAG: hypothetical protein WCT85_04020 [Parachlamydiales bacterium]
MQIKIKQKPVLISHKIGSSFLIKNTSFFVTIYPGLLWFKDLNSKKQFRLFLNFQGPQKRFTVLHDLKNGQLKIFFETNLGFFSYKIKNDSNKKLILFFENLPNNVTEIKSDSDANFKKISAKESISLPIEQINDLQVEEQLSFGVLKKQDIELIKKREDLLEILPFIFMLSQYYLDTSAYASKNVFIENLKTLMQNNEKILLEEALHNVYKALFFDAFVPRANDEEYQNIGIFKEEPGVSPVMVFSELYRIIKSLLINEDADGLYLLPCLLVSLHHGKAVNLKVSFGLVDLEWSKKILKKVVIRSADDLKIKLNLQAKIKNFRLKEDEQGKGKICQNSDEITLKKNRVYYLDNFKK